MKTVFNMKNLMIMKNYSKYICTFILLMGMNVSAWGVVTTAELNFGTAAVSETFEACTAGTQTTGSSSTTILSDMTSYGVFTHCYIGRSTESKFSIQGSASPMTSNYLQLENNTNTVGVGFTRSFASRGAFSFKIAKSSKAYIGLYTAAPNSNAIAKDNVAVFLNFTGSAIQIHNGSSGGWVNAVTSLPDGDILEIAIVYNTSTATTYGNSIPLGANRAHIYVNGSAKMSGDVPQEFTIPSSRSLSFFNVTFGGSSTTAKIDDIAIYDALPTKAGNTITLNKNNVDDGSTGGTGTILTDATSMTIDAAPTRTGYTVEGYYTTASDGVKIAAANGALQSNVTVSSTSWTNGSGVWQNVGDKTFYTYWSPIEYIIEYNKNNNAATGTMEDQEFVYGTAQNLSKCGFSREGYTFSGWATTADDGKEYDDEEEVNNLTSTEDDIITLFAMWTPNNYKLTVGTPSNVTIKATPEDKSDITEGNFDAAVPCDATITLDAVVDAGYSQAGWKITKDADESDVTTSYLYDETTMFMPPFDATITATMYGDFVFSCSELTLTPKLVTAGAPIFITSAAGKKVRSQDSILIVGSGLTPSTALTFPDLPAKFEVKSRTGAALATDASGAINAVAYIFYTPAVGNTDDGLDKLTGITVQVEGAKPKTASLTQSIIGRHLPAAFVIAAKHDDNQWYALPADLGNASNPFPVAIRVNNESNPTIAYCANTNSYTLYQDNVSNSQKVILGTTNNKNGSGVSYALWGSAGDNTLGINTSVVVTGNPGDQYKWTLTQTATSISTIADAKYNIRVSGNSNDLKLQTNAGLTKWGSYVSGVKELRLLTLSEVAPMTMKVMEWGTDAIVVSYPNGGSVTSPQVRIGDGDAANVTLTSLGGDIYKIATISGLQSNPAKTLIFTATESSVAKQIALAIPLIVSDAKTEADLRGAVPGANATEKNKVAKLTDVIIRNGGRLTTGTASGNFNDVYIYPGGKAKITNNFAANNIYMRGGYSFLDEKESFRYPDLCVEGAVTIDLPAANKLYYDFYIDNRKYYMFSMPYDVTLSTVTDETGSEDFPVWVKHYDGNLRASGHGVSGWTWYGDEEGQGSFKAGIGYEITAQPKTSGRPIAIIRFPVITGDITTDAENSPGVTVTYHGKSAYEAGTQTANNVGWNFIGNPYLTEYKAVTDTSMIVKRDFVQHIEAGQWDGTYEWKETSARFITVPYDTYNDYHHELVKGYTIPAFSTFFFQFAEGATGTFHMGGDRPQATLAPARFGAVPKAKPEISLDIMLHGTGEAEEGKAGLIIHESYDGGLKDFEDVEQWFVGNNVQKTYTFASGTALAYNLLNEEAIGELIPMGYIATVGGEHVYALNEENDVSALEHLWLIDYSTGVTTDLLVRDYSFITAAGRFDSRFAINAVLKQEEVPTNISNTPGGDWTTTIGVYSDENMLTLRGLPDNSAVYIYDMNGRLLQSSEKLSNIASFRIATQGVYNIRVIAEGKAITLRTVLR